MKALRQKDESIYDQTKKFFSEEEDGSTSHDDQIRRTKSKPKTYKDLVREEILEKMEKDDDGVSSVDTDSDIERRDIKSEQSQERLKKLAYDDEQKALREEFLKDDSDERSSGEDGDGYDDLLVKKKKSDDSSDGNDKERLEAIEALGKTVASNGSTLVDPKGEVEDGENFLLDFIKNKRWIDRDDSDSDSDSQGQTPTDHRMDDDADGHDSDSSLQELDRTDAFESKYNFRFEEAANENSGAGLSVIGYSRSALSDTIRRKDDSRRLKRQQRKERKEAERKAKEERLRRLKNAKKEELEERIKQIKSVLGEKVDADIDQEVVAKLMEGDFDPDKFEELMAKMYSDDFYEKEEQEWKTEMDVKQSLLKSGGEEGNDIVWNEEGDGDVYDDAEEEAVVDNDYENHEDATQDEMEPEDDHDQYETNESTLDKQLKERMLDELYKLDYEDIIGDMPTRFKYRNVKANRYGLTPEEILFARDSSLKQYVSLKRMAPYIEDGEYVPGAKKRRRFREMSKTEITEEMQKYASENVQNKAKGEGEDDEGQRKKKRRRQKKKKSTQGQHNDHQQSDAQTQQNSKSTKDTDKDFQSETSDPPKNNQNSKKHDEKSKKTDKKKSTKRKEKTSPESSKVKKKDRKKSEKKNDKKQKVDGVSSSRLASYGL